MGHTVQICINRHYNVRVMKRDAAEKTVVLGSNVPALHVLCVCVPSFNLRKTSCEETLKYKWRKRGF